MDGILINIFDWIVNGVAVAALLILGGIAVYFFYQFLTAMLAEYPKAAAAIMVACMLVAIFT